MKLKNNKLNLLFHSIVFLLIGLIIAFNRDDFISTDNYGDAGFVVENYSNCIIEGQTFSAILNPQDKNANSIRVLVVAPDEEYGKPVKLSVYQNDSEIPAAERYLTESEVNSGQYVYIDLPKNFSREKTTVVLESAETDAQKAVRVAFGSAVSTEVAEWYCADILQPGIPAVSLTYSKIKTLPSLTILLAFCVLIMSIAAGFIKSSNIKMPKVVAVILEMGTGMVLSLMSLNCIEILQYGNVLGLSYKSIVGNLFIIWGIAGCVFVVISRITTAFAVSSVITTLFGVINHYLIDFRGTTLLPTDISGAFTAAAVVGGYTFTIDENVVCAIAVVIVSFFACNIRFADYKIKLPIKIVGKAMALVLGIVMIITPAVKKEMFSAELNLYRQLVSSRSTNGFLMNFAINVPLLIREQPENYDPDAVNKIMDVQFESSANAENTKITYNQKPNIIFVMNESFCDPRTLIDVKNSDKLLPNIDKLKENPKAHVGQVAVSVFGGGTSCTEYEIITGFSMRVDSANYSPYMTYFNRKTPTIVWQMAENGYDTSALHLASGKNWYRNTAYPKAGFERTIFLNEADKTLEDSKGILTAKKVTNYGELTDFPTDAAGYSIITELIEESEAPVFNYYITMQNHGGYSDAGVEYNAAEDEWSVYLKLMNESDRQLGDFIDELEKWKSLLLWCSLVTIGVIMMKTICINQV